MKSYNILKYFPSCPVKENTILYSNLRSKAWCNLLNNLYILMILFILLTYLSTNFFACSLDQMDTEKDYFPLQIGNYWSYKYDFRTPDGIVTDTLDYKITSRIIEVSGKTYYEFNKPMPFFPSNWIIPNIGEQLLRQNENGNILVSIDSSEYLYFIFDNPPVDSLIKMKLSNMDYWIRIESNYQTVKTKVGTFKNCLKMHCYFPEIKGTLYFIWFHPGDGPVKIYYPEFDITYELIELDIK